MKVSPYFVAITAIFVTCLIIANIIAVKLIDVFGLTLPAAIIIFPLSYIVADILTEVYGYAQARRVIWLGFVCNLIAVIAITLAQMLPAAAFWDGQEAFERILGYAPRLLLASFAAYLVGEFANAYVLARLKIVTQGRWLWLRTIGSTVVGQGLDSAVFVTIAFIGTPGANLPLVILTQWWVKTAYEVTATPFTYLIVNYLKSVEQIDVYDRDTNFSPVMVQ